MVSSTLLPSFVVYQRMASAWVILGTPSSSSASYTQINKGQRQIIKESKQKAYIYSPRLNGIGQDPLAEGGGLEKNQMSGPQVPTNESEMGTCHQT